MADPVPDPELGKWLRYYRDLGFKHLYCGTPRAPVGDATERAFQPVQAPVQPPVQPEDMTKKQDTRAAPRVASTVESTTRQSGLFATRAERETLEQIREDLGDCRRCKLWGGRKTIVFGSGNAQAELLFVGEGPGADEDEQGLPFVGRAGQLLTDMIEKGLQIPRPEVYICNIVKCRPPGNRKPERDEVAACREFVERQIDSVHPKVICALGATAAETMLGVRESMGRLRGRWFEFHEIPLMVTYHPAFLLRDPSRKGETWQDLKQILARLRSPSPAV